VVAGHSGEFTPGGYLSTQCDSDRLHTTAAGLEPTTFRLLIRRATTSAIDWTHIECSVRTHDPLHARRHVGRAVAYIH